MTKLVPFLGRKAFSAAARPAPAAEGAPAKPAADQAAAARTDIELDQDLFFPVATQLGQENEAVRNLLIDAEHKIGELEIIKNSIGKLVDPVAKTLRAYEETKSEKLSLQSVLNSTRIAQAKLRDDFVAAEKKSRTLEAECARLRDVVAMAQQSVASHEKTKAEHLAELSARRAQIAELQRHVHQQGADLQQSREESRRHVERVAAADRRAVQLEGQAQAAEQKAQQSAQERAAVQAALDKSHGELALTARRLTESDRALAAAQSRLRSVETGLAEAQAERTRLAAALDELNHRHLDEMNMQNSRFQALKARATLTEGLLEEARQTLMARADEIRSFERRVIETSTAHDNAGERLAQMMAALADRDARIAELEQSQAALQAHNEALNDVTMARDSAYGSAEQKIREQADLIALLENQLKAARSAHDMQIEQLRAQLQREQLERSMAEGALESGRKDIARLLREVGAMQSRSGLAADAPSGTLRSAA
jgi:chromosome segregation ATPase